VPTGFNIPVTKRNLLIYTVYLGFNIWGCPAKKYCWFYDACKTIFFFAATVFLGLRIHIKSTFLVTFVKGGATVGLAMFALSAARLFISPQVSGCSHRKDRRKFILFEIVTTTSRRISVFLTSRPKTDNLREGVRKLMLTWNHSCFVDGMFSVRYELESVSGRNITIQHEGMKSILSPYLSVRIYRL
jgi:hypothetical protein